MIDLYDVKVNGLHYVREIRNQLNERVGYLLIDNRNKPIKSVFKYLQRKRKRDGNSINTEKRICYDLAYFFDYMLLEKIDIETIDYENMYNFISSYLTKINPAISFDDAIERSMTTKIPLLDIYDKKNIDKIIPANKNKVNGLSSESIQRICNNVKQYIIFLHEIEKKEIDISNIFREVVINVDKNSNLLGHLNRGRRVEYSVNGILKAAGVNIKINREANPITSSRIFEDDEMDMFFSVIRANKNIMYYLFFYLLKVTGMRISEARGLRIYKVPRVGKEINWNELEGDIRLIDEANSIFEVSIEVRGDNPADICIKAGRSRKVNISDSQGILKGLLRQALIYRGYKTREKKQTHQFLFINRNGERFLNARTEQVFKETLNKAGLGGRHGDGQLQVHSFRHTYASIWIKSMRPENAAMSLKILSNVLGHKSIETTRNIYLHFFKKDLIDTLNLMEANKYICK